MFPDPGRRSLKTWEQRASAELAMHLAEGKDIGETGRSLVAQFTGRVSEKLAT